MATRQGKHRDGKVSIGFYATVEFKALLAYVVDQSGETATDIMMEGVKSKAVRLGIIDKEGNIVKRHQAAIDLIAEIYRNTTKKGEQK